MLVARLSSVLIRFQASPCALPCFHKFSNPVRNMGNVCSQRIRFLRLDGPTPSAADQQTLKPCRNTPCLLGYGCESPSMFAMHHCHTFSTLWAFVELCRVDSSLSTLKWHCAHPDGLTDGGAHPFEHIELPANLLDYFLRSNKSNVNQTLIPARLSFGDGTCSAGANGRFLT